MSIGDVICRMVGLSRSGPTSTAETFLFKNKLAEDFTDDREFSLGAALKDYAVGLQVFSLTSLQYALWLPLLVEQQPTEVKACRTSLPKSLCDEVALGRKPCSIARGYTRLPWPS